MFTFQLAHQSAHRLAWRLACRWLAVVLLCSCAAASAQQALRLPNLDGMVLNAWWFAAAEPVAQAQDPKPRPVVIALHGCSGLYNTTGARKGQLNARHMAMALMLQAQGYHVVLPDSFTPRGEGSICVQKIGMRNITQKERRADALGTLAWVRKQPWASSTQVAVLGWSHGGSAVLAATDAARNGAESAALPASAALPSALLSALPAALPEPFALALAFYPGCTDALSKGYRPNTRLVLFLGADDDWTPPQPCISLAEQLQSGQTAQPHSVELHVYPGAVHDFDNPLPGVRQLSSIPSRLHAGQGVMTGQNLAAREASWARVRSLLAEAFR